MYYMILPTNKDLQHHGILGMKWGIRRFQNKDGSLTAWGKRRLGIGNDSGVTSNHKAINTNKSGTSPRSPFSEANNIKTVNKILKDTDNCSFCTFAYDLRKRGIDVTAGGNVNKYDGATGSSIASWYKGSRKFSKNSEFYSCLSADGGRLNNFNKKTADQKFKNQILSQGNGASGHMSFQNVIDRDYADRKNMDTQFLGGHDVFYQVENGEVYIIDAQSGKKVTYDEYANKNNSIDPRYTIKMYPTRYLRTDDLEPDIKLNDDGTLFLSPKNKNTNVVNPYKSATSNYSPSTISIETKPMSYSPPYKSKSDFDLLVEDGKKLVNKVVNKILDNPITWAIDELDYKVSRIIDDAKYYLWRHY